MKKRNTTKLTRAAIAMAAVASVTAQAEIELAEGFSLQGFLDVSAQRSDVDGRVDNSGAPIKDTESTAEIAEFESGIAVKVAGSLAVVTLEPGIRADSTEEDSSP